MSVEKPGFPFASAVEVLRDMLAAPGLAGAALVASDVTVQVILDGVHLVPREDEDYGWVVDHAQRLGVPRLVDELAGVAD